MASGKEKRREERERECERELMHVGREREIPNKISQNREANIHPSLPPPPGLIRKDNRMIKIASFMQLDKSD